MIAMIRTAMMIMMMTMMMYYDRVMLVSILRARMKP